MLWGLRKRRIDVVHRLLIKSQSGMCRFRDSINIKVDTCILDYE
jgi:hypothetical protein